MDDTRILNMKSLLERIGGDEEFAKELIGDFLQSLPEDLRTLESHLEEENLEQAAKSAHAIKGSSANLSAEEVSAISRVVEESCREGDLGGALQAFEKLPPAAERLSVEFKKA
jgi:HPt (histidine-containing phosphotransfer) domain-containing protein